MKWLFTALSLVFIFSSSAQSPYLSIIVKMDSSKAAGTRHKIEMKICQVKNSQRGDWFTYDTSKVNFASLKISDLICGKYFDNGLPTLISGNQEKKPVNQFEFANQLFVWEHVFVFKISNMSSRGWLPEMYIVIPVKYKSFNTKIEITGIGFQPGKVIFLDNLEGKYHEKELFLSSSLKNEPTVKADDFPLEEILKNK